MPYYISPPPRSPLTRLVAAVIGVFVLTGAVILGTAALLVIAGLAVIAGLGLWLRVAWIRHQQRRGVVTFKTAAQGRAPTRSAGREAIDAEYTVISVQESKHD